MDYEVQIGHEILEKYENSVLFKRPSAVKDTVTINATNSKLMKKYRMERNIGEQKKYEVAFMVLEREGYIRCRRESGGAVIDASLNLDQYVLPLFYLRIGREDPEFFFAHVLGILSQYKDDNEILRSLYEFEKEAVDAREIKRAHRYAKNGQELGLACLGISQMLKLDRAMTERDFSQMVYKDTKVFASNRSLIERILRDFGNEGSEEGEDIVERYGVSKNKAYAYVKNGLVIRINNQVIDLDAYGTELPLSDSAIDNMEILDMKSRGVITVENLTSFYEVNESEYTYVYLGGYHNTVRQALITKIASKFPNKEYLHFGDMDPDGFQILQVLRRKTGINFMAYKMDRAVLESNLERAKRINEHDLSLLERELANPEFSDFYDSLQAIKDNGLKLEQESLFVRQNGDYAE